MIAFAVFYYNGNHEIHTLDKIFSSKEKALLYVDSINEEDEYLDNNPYIEEIEVIE